MIGLPQSTPSLVLLALMALLAATPAASVAQTAPPRPAAPAPATHAPTPPAPTELDRERGWQLERTPDNDDEAQRRLLGVLVSTEATLGFGMTPTREAFDTVRDRLGIPLVGRYRDDGRGVRVGIDPFEPLTVKAGFRNALELLEAMLEKCVAGGEKCTWQLRNGFVEFGPKSRLSVPAARERRTYYVADLIIDIPEDHRKQRKRREVVALTVVKEIVETIEPDAWDYGQIDYDEPVEGEFGYRRNAPDGPPGRPPGRPPGSPPGGSASSPAAAGAGVTDPDAAAARPPRRYVAPRKTAIIRYWRDVLIIDAPGFIHRELAGLPEPILPRGAPR